MKNFGYVCFKQADDAQTAMERLNKKPLANEQFLIVNPFISKKDNELLGNKSTPISQNLTKTFNSNIFVKFIPAELSEEEIKKIFGEAGRIISVKIKTSISNYNNYQYGYILYEKVEEAQNAIKKFDQQSILGSRPLKVELWQSKSEMEQEKKQRENREVNSILNMIIK